MKLREIMKPYLHFIEFLIYQRFFKRFQIKLVFKQQMSIFVEKNNMFTILLLSSEQFFRTFSIDLTCHFCIKTLILILMENTDTEVVLVSKNNNLNIQSIKINLKLLLILK